MAYLTLVILIALRIIFTMKIAHCNNIVHSDILLDGGAVGERMCDPITRSEQHSATVQQCKSGATTSYHQFGHHSTEAAIWWSPGGRRKSLRLRKTGGVSRKAEDPALQSNACGLDRAIWIKVRPRSFWVTVFTSVNALTPWESGVITVISKSLLPEGLD